MKYINLTIALFVGIIIGMILAHYNMTGATFLNPIKMNLIEPERLEEIKIDEWLDGYTTRDNQYRFKEKSASDEYVSCTPLWTKNEFVLGCTIKKY